MNSLIHSHSLVTESTHQSSYVWTNFSVIPFNELLISWNSLRPAKGHYVILSRVLMENKWSPWLLYAVWGHNAQFSFHDTTSAAPVRSFQDQVELHDDKVATGFSIRIEACHGASLKNFHVLYASTTNLDALLLESPPPETHFTSLPVPKISQLGLSHPRCKSLCSPTSTTSVIQFHNPHHPICPLKFSQCVYDSGFDIYGNWSFNIAQAYVELGDAWKCFYGRMIDKKWLFRALKNGMPLVISIKGTLTESFVPYTNGHLLVIKGYNANTQEVLCMDPAFPSNDQTEKAYAWKELISAWKNRHYLTYFFLPTSIESLSIK